MKNRITIITLLLLSIGMFAQEDARLNLFTTDSTWIKEIIKFPLGFAQEIKFEGFEDLRFPTGWSKKDSPMFWSYLWAWSIDNTEELTEADMEKNVQLYFNGLMGIGSNKNAEGEIHLTTAVFVKNPTTTGKSEYIGKVTTFDTRYTNKPLTFHVLAEQHYCEDEKKTVVVFRYSPKAFEHEAWNQLNSVQLNQNPCEN